MKTLKLIIFLYFLLNGFLLVPALAANAAQGQQKSSVCLGCHGANGKSNSPQWPNLAAQQAPYIVNQLKAFKEKSRTNPMMESMATSLSEDDINNLAAYYSSQPAVSAGGDAVLAKAGQAKAGMCQGCHGAKLEGNGQFPRLAGQHPGYLLKQLKSFKEGARQNGHMQAIAGSLSEEDMKALGAYFGSLTP